MASNDEILSRLRRTLKKMFGIGSIQIKDNAGTVELRNADDTGYTDLAVNVANVEGVAFDLTTSISVTEGKLLWDASGGTLSLGLKGGNLILPVGQSYVARVKNVSGVTINKGAAVYVVGAIDDLPSVALANSATHATAIAVLGLASESIPSGSEGFVTAQGVISGIDTSAYVAGDKLFLSSVSSGDYVANTPPSSPATSVYLGTVIVDDATMGAIYVSVDSQSQLSKLADVLISNPLEGQVLKYDSASSLWKNNATAAKFFPILVDENFEVASNDQVVTNNFSVLEGVNLVINGRVTVIA